MKFAFSLELSSQEALIGYIAGIAVFVLVLILRGRRPPTHRATIVSVAGSPAAYTSVDQSRRTQVNVSATVAVATGAMVPQHEPPRRRNKVESPSSNGGRDDAGAIFGVAAMAVVVAALRLAQAHLG